jgi:5-methylcytosine-specific restriction endonuclease McrA
MNTYKTSQGERIKKSEIDHRVRWAKKAALTKQINEHGYNFCENTICSHPNMAPFDCAHIISVNECQKQGKSELAWDIKNIQILCRTCHQWYDGLNLKFKSNEK